MEARIKIRLRIFLLKKCEFGDYHELNTIKKISDNDKVLFLDCGCNYGFLLIICSITFE